MNMEQQNQKHILVVVLDQFTWTILSAEEVKEIHLAALTKDGAKIIVDIKRMQELYVVEKFCDLEIVCGVTLVGKLELGRNWNTSIDTVQTVDQKCLCRHSKFNEVTAEEALNLDMHMLAVPRFTMNDEKCHRKR